MEIWLLSAYGVLCTGAEDLIVGAVMPQGFWLKNEADVDVMLARLGLKLVMLLSWELNAPAA